MRPQSRLMDHRGSETERVTRGTAAIRAPLAQVVRKRTEARDVDLGYFLPEVDDDGLEQPLRGGVQSRRGLRAEPVNDQPLAVGDLRRIVHEAEVGRAKRAALHDALETAGGRVVIQHLRSRFARRPRVLQRLIELLDEHLTLWAPPPPPAASLARPRGGRGRRRPCAQATA